MEFFEWKQIQLNVQKNQNKKTINRQEKCVMEKRQMVEKQCDATTMKKEKRKITIANKLKFYEIWIKIYFKIKCEKYIMKKIKCV